MRTATWPSSKYSRELLRVQFAKGDPTLIRDGIPTVIIYKIPKFRRKIERRLNIVPTIRDLRLRIQKKRKITCPVLVTCITTRLFKNTLPILAI